MRRQVRPGEFLAQITDDRPNRHAIQYVGNIAIVRRSVVPDSFSAVAILQVQCATGQIGRDEYEQMRRDIKEGHGDLAMVKPPPKRPVQKREGLRFGIDIDGTIAQAPHHFKRLIDALLAHGDQAYIVTGRWERIRKETETLLRSLSINYTELIMRPNDWQGTVADFKVKVVQEKRLHLTFDDDERNCWAISQQTEALAAHMLPFPETEVKAGQEELSDEVE